MVWSYGSWVFLIRDIQLMRCGVHREVEKQLSIHRTSNIGIFGGSLKDMANVPSASCSRSSMLSSKGIFCKVSWERYLRKHLYIPTSDGHFKRLFWQNPYCLFIHIHYRGKDRATVATLLACLFSAGYARFMFHSRVFVCLLMYMCVCVCVCVCLCLCVTVLSCGLCLR